MRKKQTIDSVLFISVLMNIIKTTTHQETKESLDHHQLYFIYKWLMNINLIEIYNDQILIAFDVSFFQQSKKLNTKTDHLKKNMSFSF